LKWFDYECPRTVEAAVGLLSTPGRKVRALAGGTDLIVQLRAGRRDADLVVDVKEIGELNELRLDSAGLLIGAAVPCYRIYNDPAIARAWPGIIDAVSIIGGTQIQGRATLGGNLANAAPSADAVPVLIALGARCRIAGPAGKRSLAVEDFCVAPGRNALAPGELLVSVEIPAQPAHSGAAYLRFIPRNEMDIAVVGVGASVALEDGVFRAARIALASVAPTPLFVPAAGESLIGKPVGEAAIQAASEIAQAAAKPITDMRGTAAYRRHLCGVMTRRALGGAIARARENR
jgi:carbon-monoxide dehydrogenase medium subunit